MPWQRHSFLQLPARVKRHGRGPVTGTHGAVRLPRATAPGRFHLLLYSYATHLLEAGADLGGHEMEFQEKRPRAKNKALSISPIL